MIGLELAEGWWGSRAAESKRYIPARLVSMPPDRADVPSGSALLFCYFNNGPAFREYIRAYGGRLVLIVGPGPKQARYTDPEPFNPNFGPDGHQWQLTNRQEIANTGDFVSAWSR